MKEIEYKEFIGYTDYQKLIYYLAGKWHIYLGISFEDAVCEANYAYSMSLQTYKHNKIKFSSYLTNKILGYYKNLFNKRKEENSMLYETEISRNYRNDVDVLKDDLSFDAVYLIDLILSPTKDLQKMLDSKKDLHKDRKIKKYLYKYCEWDKKKIEQIFLEIKNNL